MTTMTRKSLRAAESAGAYTKLHGEFKLAALSGAATVVAAGTTTAGHVFAMRNPSTTKKAVIRYVNVQLAMTTAFGALQPIGYDLIVARNYSASHTGGTAIDMFTLTGSQKVRANQELTLFTVNTVRIATTTALTAGTHDLDSLPLASKLAISPTLGGVADFTLLDARDDGAGTHRSPIVLGTNEGIVIRNMILMGATGVGNIAVNVEWDEATV